MTAPQPDTETLVARVLRAIDTPHDVRTQGQIVKGAGRKALDVLRARLAETEAQRDDALRALIAEVRRVAALEAALEEICDRPHGELNEHEMRSIAAAALDSLPSQSAQTHGRGCPCSPCQREDWDAVEARLPSQPASLTAEDAAYVARRATWERK